MSPQAMHAHRSILCAALLSITPLVAQTTPTITEFPNIPGGIIALTSGPDNALWFGASQIGRISTTGNVTTPGSSTGTGTCVPGIGCTGGGGGVPSNLQVQAMVTGPDGAVWFTNASPAFIGRITPAGALTQFSVPSSYVPAQIATGGDGNLWFTIANPGFPFAAPTLIFRMATAGVVTSFTTKGNPLFLTRAADGSIWFTETLITNGPPPNNPVGAWLGRIDQSGNLTENAVATTSLGNITSGPDGALWFNAGGNGIGRMTTSGAVTFYPLTGISLSGLTSGPDGALWATDGTNNQLVRVTMSGVVSTYAIPTANSGLSAITTGPDGNIWFAESTADKIGRLALTTTPPPGQIQITTSSPLPVGTFGVPYSLALTANGGLPPYTWLLASGALPPGLTLSSGGVISGTPAAIGTFSFTVQATDAASNTASQGLVLTVNAITCTYTTTTMFTDATGNISTGPFAFLPSGLGQGVVNISTAAGCPWSVSGAPSWITTSASSAGGTSGTGPGPVVITVAPNYGPNPRTGSFTVAGNTFSITQQAGLVPSSGYMPHLAAEGGWTTSFTLVNKGFLAADTQLHLTDNNGNPLPLPLSFPQQAAANSTMEASFDQVIAPNASLIVQASGPSNVPYVEGSAQMTSAGGVDGFAIFRYNPSGQEAVVPLGGSGTIIPFDNTNGVLTGIAVENASQSSASIPIILRDDTGAQIGTGQETVLVGPNGHASFVLSTQFPVTANIRGTIQFVTFRPSAQIFQPVALGIRYTPPGTLTTLAALNSPAGSAVGLIPHIASGNGWQTTFVIVNTSGTQQPMQLNFFDNTGNPLPIPFTVMETGGSTTNSSLSLSIPPYASRWIQTTGSTAAALLSGSAQLSGGVSGFAIYRYNPNGQEAVVPMETRNAGSYLIAFDNTNGTNTGIAISLASSQPSGTPIGVPVLVRDDSGNQIAAATVPIASNGHLSQGLTTLFPSTANIRGTIEFDTPQGASVSVLGIRSPPALTFTTLPALAR